jgi:hypothetical protein
MAATASTANRHAPRTTDLVPNSLIEAFPMLLAEPARAAPADVPLSLDTPSVNSTALLFNVHAA